MAKMVILSCEVCGIIDSAENRVVTANVCGHRVELCKKERVQLLTSVGVSELHAIAYCDRFDEQAGRGGANPSLAQVAAEVNVVQADGVTDVPAAEEPVEDLVSVGAAEETVVEAAPRPKRR